MIIHEVKANNRQACFQIKTRRGEFSFPFIKLRLVPSSTNRITDVYVDREAGKQAITYVLQSGDEDTVHLDDFLHYNRDPDYVRDLTLYNLTVRAVDLVKRSKLPKRELARKLKTSPAQVYRLLDPTNYTKTIDQMVRLLACLDCTVDVRVSESKDSTPTNSAADTEIAPKQAGRSG